MLYYFFLQNTTALVNTTFMLYFERRRDTSYVNAVLNCNTEYELQGSKGLRGEPARAIEIEVEYCKWQIDTHNTGLQNLEKAPIT